VPIVVLTAPPFHYGKSHVAKFVSNVLSREYCGDSFEFDGGVVYWDCTEKHWRTALAELKHEPNSCKLVVLDELDTTITTLEQMKEFVDMLDQFITNEQYYVKVLLVMRHELKELFDQYQQKWNSNYHTYTLVKISPEAMHRHLNDQLKREKKIHMCKAMNRPTNDQREKRMISTFMVMLGRAPQLISRFIKLPDEYFRNEKAFLTLLNACLLQNDIGWKEVHDFAKSFYDHFSQQKTTNK